MSNAELIEALRRAEGSETLRSVYLGMLNAEHRCKQAADALSAYEWQPIDTAPKDGTVIFVWHISRINAHAAMDTNIKKAQWLKEADCWRVEGVGGNVEPTLTGWMHLPKPITGDK